MDLISIPHWQIRCSPHPAKPLETNSISTASCLSAVEARDGTSFCRQSVFGSFFRQKRDKEKKHNNRVEIPSSVEAVKESTSSAKVLRLA